MLSISEEETSCVDDEDVTRVLNEAKWRIGLVGDERIRRTALETNPDMTMVQYQAFATQIWELWSRQAIGCRTREKDPPPSLRWI